VTRRPVGPYPNPSDWRRELEPAAFGPPVGGRQCAACRRWFPWGNYYRGRRKPAALRCLECIEQHRMAPP
jgi:hypothetical protein